MHNLVTIPESFNKLSALVIGDVMLDSYLWGRVDRISPEAPVPIVEVTKQDKRLGGAANVALNLQALGATPYLCAVVGTDTEAGSLLALLNSHNMPTEGIVADASRPTTIKHRIMSGSTHLLRLDTESTLPINHQVTKALIAQIKIILPKVQVVIFEDYDKGVLGQYLIQTVIQLAKAAGVPTVVDPKKRNFSFYNGATLFKPNLKELKEGLNLTVNGADLDSLKQTTSSALGALGVDGLLLTLSENGMFLDNGNTQHHIPAFLRNIIDVSGAGDTVVAIAALCLALNLKPEWLLTLSNLGGGLVCESPGVVPISKQALFAEASKYLS